MLHGKKLNWSHSRVWKIEKVLVSKDQEPFWTLSPIHQHGDQIYSVSISASYNDNRYWEYIVSKEIKYQWNMWKAE